MLAKKYKLPVDSAINKKGALTHGQYFLLKKLPSSLKFSRLAVAIGKKNISSVVSRNKIKRVVFSFFQKNKLYESLPPVDYLLIAKPSIKRDIEKHDIINELNNIFHGNTRTPIKENNK
jgi:ribonuclease P protein component